MDILLELLIVIIFVICVSLYCCIGSFYDLQTMLVVQENVVVPVNQLPSKNKEKYIVFIQPTREIILGISK